MLLQRLGLVLTLVAAFQAAPSEWKTHAPTPAGWRNVTMQMTVEDVARALAAEVAPAKPVNYSDGTTGSEMKLKKKVAVDGIDYEVKFGFDAERRIQSIAFFSNKVKKETFAGVVAAFTDLRGQPTATDHKAMSDGGTLDTTSWTVGESSLNVNYATIPLGGFVTGRIVTVVMVARKAS
jgi:hypothetical protein